MAAKSKKEITYQFPDLVQKRLLEIVLQAGQLEQEKGTILGTFFSTIGIENPQDYEVNLRDNTITLKKEEVASKK